MQQPQNNKNAIEKFREKPFRKRFITFFVSLMIWLLIMVLFSTFSSGSYTSYSFQGYWISSLFFIFAAYKICFKKEF